MAESVTSLPVSNEGSPYKGVYIDDGGQDSVTAQAFQSEKEKKVMEGEEETKLSSMIARSSYSLLLSSRKYQVELLIHFLANAENLRSALYDFENALRWVAHRLMEMNGREEE